MNESKVEITREYIGNFLAGTHPQERIVKIEGTNQEDCVYVYYRDENGVKKCQKDNFYPFLWAKLSACLNLFQGDKEKLKQKLREYGIKITKLRTENENGEIHPRMDNGYKFLFQSYIPMSYNRFLNFFEEAGVPVYSKDKNSSSSNSYMVVSNIEQYMIYTGKRLFKGYDDYNQLTRFIFDLETSGIDLTKDVISQIGMSTNKGFEKILTVEGEGKDRLDNECRQINTFFKTIKEIDPDIITGYNSENFDIPMIASRLEKMGSNLKDFTKDLFYGGFYKKANQTPLKLGGETEYYFPTVVWGMNITDGLFAVRRAQALDSNMKKTGLKYITKYSKLNKPNRVYLPGDKIEKTWKIKTPDFILNEKNGEWLNIASIDFNKEIEWKGEMLKEYQVVDRENFVKNVIVHDDNGDSLEEQKFHTVTGQYIAERYLLDDLNETDLVELRYNQSNFLVCKMLPTSFEKCCTMGTAGIWKLIMMAWSYQHGLAIPKGEDKRNFTGGLSRLLKCGYVPNIVKLDYNSLYPSIILSYGVKTPIDIMGAMLLMLEYVLTQREKYKELKSVEGKKGKKMKKQLDAGEVAEEERDAFEAEMRQHITDSALYDKMQLPLKILGNSFFGSFGADGKIFPWCDMDAAERTTCVGRQSLRLMIGVFSTPKDEILPHFKAMLERGIKLANGEITEEEAGEHCSVTDGYITGKFETGYITQEEFDAIEDYNKYGRGFEPVVGDSFTEDTPMFIKYDETGWIDIKPVKELFNIHNFHVDGYGREYDYTQKPYKVLCRSGWEYPTYIYRHNTKKDIYRVYNDNGDGYIDVTQDHSLFKSNYEEIKPEDIEKDTELEYCGEIPDQIYDYSNPEDVDGSLTKLAGHIANGKKKRLPITLLNANKETIVKFLSLLDNNQITSEYLSTDKTLMAQVMYLRRKGHK